MGPPQPVLPAIPFEQTGPIRRVQSSPSLTPSVEQQSTEETKELLSSYSHLQDKDFLAFLRQAQMRRFVNDWQFQVLQGKWRSSFNAEGDDLKEKAEQMIIGLLMHFTLSPKPPTESNDDWRMRMLAVSSLCQELLDNIK